MSYDPSTSAGRVRMLIADSDDDNRIMSDAEITAALALNGSDVYGAAADCCRSIAASAAKSAIAWSTLNGQMRVDKKKIPDVYLALAKEYEAKVGLTDSTDYFVDWPLLISKVDGYDDSDYEDDDDSEYFQVHYWDGDV